MRPAASCSSRKALVRVPGTATFMPGRSEGSTCSRATTIGPYCSPIDAPWGSSRYLSATVA